MKIIPSTRLYHPEAGNPFIHASDEDTLAVQRVLRLRTGERVICFSGDGMEYFYLIEAVESRALCLSLLESQPNARDPRRQLTVCIASTKGRTKDRMVKDLTPLGVSRIVFYEAERSVAKPEPKQQERLWKIAVEACRQCGRSTVPQVDSIPAGLPELWAQEQFNPKQVILFWERAAVEPFSLPFPEGAQTLLFGPEGGFSEAEIAFLQGQSLQTASLGRRILRSELAVVVGVTLVQAQRDLY
ncbi:MAG: RsmE family RNA methyltransferase [bacterium]